MVVIVLLDGLNRPTICGPFEDTRAAMGAMNMRDLGSKYGGLYFYTLRDIREETVPAPEAKEGKDEPAEHPA